MTQAFGLACFGAASIAIASAFFGVVLARMVWADDLAETNSLKLGWDRIEKLQRGTIESQERTIENQQKTIEILNPYFPGSSGIEGTIGVQ